ncbi:MBL fold metallo-hydrolase [Mesobaculum littorinae]|uniref:MBL fold metallo-hydrolase n=1 Tax=Mesobaculum littorinae TaxID=2486419 RepID=A0A438AKH1_9RHOB|nr:MBL fold metallo-hydrolase [Mesobaculum littorinae]
MTGQGEGRGDAVWPGLPEGVSCVIAPNAGPLTGSGTNTWILVAARPVVIDPGPDDPAHLAAILAHLDGRRPEAILVTHAHADHAGLARPLAARTGAPVLAYGDATAGRSPAMRALAAAGHGWAGEGVASVGAPDRALADGEVLSMAGRRIVALWTPGHFGNHLSFEVDRAIFSGDLAMGWASTLISPPDGDVDDFIASCRRLRGRDPAILLPGHGAPVAGAADRLDWLIRHRQEREAAVLAHLSRGAADLAGLTAAIYAGTDPALHPAAARNLFAHLVALHARGRVQATPALSPEALFSQADVG